jgi:hypothetical protein
MRVANAEPRQENLKRRPQFLADFPERPSRCARSEHDEAAAGDLGAVDGDEPAPLTLQTVTQVPDLSDLRLLQGGDGLGELVALVLDLPQFCSGRYSSASRSSNP